MRLSIIIPVLNDAFALSLLLRDLAAALADESIEVIVVDGGSVDGLDEILTGQAVRLLRSCPGRGQQLSTGVSASLGRVVWMLHADTRPGPDALELVAAQSFGWGRFRLRLEPDFRGMRMVGAMMHWRSRLTGICTGDQGIWVERGLLEQIGGVPMQPLMEDIELSSRLRRVAWPRVLPATLATSSRRWQKQGLVRTIIRMWSFRLKYFLGVPAQVLARSYSDIRDNRAKK